MLPEGGIETDGKSPKWLLSMRVKVSLAGLCFLLMIGLFTYSDLPYLKSSVYSLNQDTPLAENESQPTEDEAPPEIPEQETPPDKA